MSDFSISTNDIDTLDSFPSQSPAMPSSPQNIDETRPLSEAAVPESDEKQAITSNIAEEVEDAVHPCIFIESFLPLLETLESPGLESVDGIYHLRGSVTENDFKKLSAYARNVTEITLNDKGCSSVDPGTWIRLIQLGARYKQSYILFPSLKSIRIDITKDDTPLCLLPLFLVPTLESLEVVDFPVAHLNILITFLTNLADEVPKLSTIMLGKYIFYSDVVHSICMRFVNLCKLCLSNIGPVLDQMTIEDIGQLSELKTFILDAQSADYIRSESDTVVTVKPCAKPVENVDAPYAPPKFKGLLRDDKKDDKICEPKAKATHKQLSRAPSRAPSPSPSILDFNHAPITLAEPSPEGKIPDVELSPLLGFSKLMTLHITGKATLMSSIISFINSASLVDISLNLTYVQVKLRPKEPSHSSLFQTLLRDVLDYWAHSLTSIRISSSRPSHKRYVLELSIFQTLLLQPSLHHLEIYNWTLDVNIGDALHPLTTLEKPSMLETLHLPIDVGDKGISLQRLRGVVESCPHLTSFQCGFKHLSNVPSYPEIGTSFNLKTLCVGNPTAHTDRQRLREIAQYLDALFPNLETIETQEGCNAEQWKEIFELVQMCQFSRSHHLAQRA